MKLPRRIVKGSNRRAAASIGLTVFLLGIFATPAFGAPSFGVELTRDAAQFPTVSRNDERVDYTVKVTNVGPDPTSGEVTVELELPAGEETRVYRIFRPGSEDFEHQPPEGWSCSWQEALGGQPAKAVCKRSTVLSPGNSYPLIVVAAKPGADGPDTAVADATVSGGGALTPASALNEFVFEPAIPFAITAFETKVPDEDGIEEIRAGTHPFSAGASFAFSQIRRLSINAAGGSSYSTPERARVIATDTPRGFVGNALAVPELCPAVSRILSASPVKCPPGSVVGGIDIRLSRFGLLSNEPIYAIAPEFGTPAQFAFPVQQGNLTYTFTPRLRAEDGYAITLESAPSPAGEAILELPKVTLCSFGAKTVGAGTTKFNGCREAGEENAEGKVIANPKPLITLPTRCDGDPPTTLLRADSWEHPGHDVSRSFAAPQPIDCDQVPFDPQMDLVPTSRRADSPTGMDVEIKMPTAGLTDPEGISQANLKRVKVTLPEGMAVNASAGHGLGACTAAQVGIDPVTGVPDNAEPDCPDSSKLGTIGITTPLIQETLTGFIYIAKQGKDNPFDSTIALYMAFSSKKDGVTIKISGEVKPDPVTGQMVVTFDENPQAPFSGVELHFPQGPKASLINPPRCGKYEIKAELTPWTAVDPDNPTAAETVTHNTTFEVTEGPNGAPCPSGALEPKLSAGVNNPTAGQHTGFEMRLHREDGTDRFSALGLSLPPGLLGKLKGVPYCPEASIAQAQTRSDVEEGVLEINDPSCPASSQIGSVSAGAGAGQNPLYVDTGKAYLAGPYKGAPLSLVVIAPAVAGPLDLGTVVVRNQLRIDRRTAQVSAISDPVPTILHGVLLDLRDIRLKIGRPNFILNPTNCEAMAFNGEVTGEKGAKAPVSDRFQLGGCENLGFKPKLSIHLKGGTKRGDHPALVATLKARPGDANIARAAVTLPRSAFLDQAHIRTICTRVQFAADTCPKGAVYGSTEATTPLLEETLRGDSILRSSDNKLPDLVGTLNGIATVDVVGRIDSVKGGIRTTFDVVPDAPVTEFVLRMQGGKKGLVVNSQDLCAKVNKATVRFTAQNGRQFNFRPKVVADGCKKGRKPSKQHRSRAS